MLGRALSILTVIALAGCEKTDHDAIDKWKTTEKGPDKLRKALADPDLDPELSAHAAANLAAIAMDGDARTLLAAMAPARRTQVIAKLAPRLWKLARIEKDNEVPSTLTPVAAKDLLFAIREWADDAERAQIDGYLTDWYAVASYAGRAPKGKSTGPTVLRAIGPAAAKKMIDVVNGYVAASEGKTRLRIPDELLLGLAVTRDAAAVRYALELATMNTGDKSLPGRALDALYLAYVDPKGQFDVCPPDALVPSLDKLVAIAKDERTPGEVATDAIALVRQIGPPKCLPPLLAMVPHPHANPSYRYLVAMKAIQCGGVAALASVVRALPRGPYDARSLQGTIIDAIHGLTPRDKVLAELRELLADRDTLVRWVAIEGLAVLRSTTDASKIAALAAEQGRLVGYWGDQNRVDPKDRKSDPTLGQRAKQVAEQLAKP
jgi:hypothetical protein